MLKDILEVFDAASEGTRRKLKCRVPATTACQVIDGVGVVARAPVFLRTGDS